MVASTLLVTHLLLTLLFFLLGDRLHKSLRLRRFKSDRDEILQDCSSSKYASIQGVFLIWRHTVTMAALTSFHVEKSCHLASAHSASARRLLHPPAVLIHSTFVLFWSIYTRLSFYRAKHSQIVAGESVLMSTVTAGLTWVYRIWSDCTW